MKRMSVAGLAFLLLCLVHVGAAHAKAVPMSDLALQEVTGQSGIAISVGNVGFDITADTVYYKDSDGIGPGSTAGFLSLCGVKVKGSADFAKPMTVEIATEKEANGGTRVTGVTMKLSDMTLKIDTFYIDAIRLGSSPGAGGSLGSFGIDNMIVKMSGNISILAN